MFGRKKKEKKVEKVFETADSEQKEEQASQKTDADIDEELLASQAPAQEEEEEPEEKVNEKLNSVKEKISKILQSQNIEIIDENEGDEFDVSTESAEKSQADYDSLKAIFGSGEKGKKNELTVSIDDFDYTYVGKYVEEFDILHIKSIKRIKMQRKHSKLVKRLVIAAAAIIVVGISVTLGVVLTRKTPVYLESISLSQTEMNFYKNMTFKYDNIYILAHYSNGTTQRVKLTSDYYVDSTGFVENRADGSIVFSNGEQATLTFRYSGFNASIKINIITKQVDADEPIKVVCAPSFENLKPGDYISDKNLILLMHYTNTTFEYERISLSDVSIKLFTDNGASNELSYSSENGWFSIPSSVIIGENSYLEITYGSYKTTVNL